MNRLRALHILLVFGCLVIAAKPMPGQTAASLSTAASAANAGTSALDTLPDNSSVPKAMADLMQASRSRFLEGYSLIRAGDATAAREAFDAAVDMLLQSDWSVATESPLDAYFQDLIHQIKEAESKYLFPPNDEALESDEDFEVANIDDFENLDLMAITDDPELRKAMAAGMSKNDYDIPITINEMVMKSLEFWLNRGRQHFADGLVRSGQYRPLMEQVFREESLPLDLINLAQVESFFKTQALSKAKAKGIWQFGKDTAVRYGLKVTRDVDERSDPEKSTRAAARYLNDLYAMFKDWNLVLAAYNWGEGKVKRLIDSTGSTDFWHLASLQRRLPEETRRHVPLIQASAILARNPEKFGLPTRLDPPMQYVKVSVSKPIDLRAAAKLLSTSFDELKKLNPSLKGVTTPANYPNFQLKVPADSDPDIHEQLDSLPKARIRVAAEGEGRHKVRRGETLSGIALRYHTTVKALRKANRMSSKSTLKAGAILKVPSTSDSMETKASSEDKSVSSAKSPKSSAGKAAKKKSGKKVAKKRSTAKKSKKAKAASTKKKAKKKAKTGQIASK